MNSEVPSCEILLANAMYASRRMQRKEMRFNICRCRFSPTLKKILFASHPKKQGKRTKPNIGASMTRPTVTHCPVTEIPDSITSIDQANGTQKMAIKLDSAAYPSAESESPSAIEV